MDQRIDRIEKLLLAQAQHHLSFQQAKANGVIPEQSPFIQHTAHSNGMSGSRRTSKTLEAVSVRVRQFTKSCTNCRCQCHAQKQSASPKYLDWIFGQVFVGYSGLPFLAAKCDVDSCSRSRDSYASLEYWFRLGFFSSRILRLRLFHQPSFGARLELTALRRVPDNAQVINFALDGNIQGLKELFNRGLASPRDVSSTRGYSVCRVSFHYKPIYPTLIVIHSGQCMANNLRLAGCLRQ